MSSSESELPKELLEAFKQKRYAACVAGLKSLSASGTISADIALAHIYFTGGDGIPKNFGLARLSLERIYRSGLKNFYASHRLGVMYYKGLGVYPNHKVAYAFFRRAALLGHSGSLLMVAAMQKEGDKTLKKPGAARKIFVACARDKQLRYTARLTALLWLTPLTRIWVR